MKDDTVSNIIVTKTTLISIDPSVMLTDFKTKITRPYTILYVEEKKQELWQKVKGIGMTPVTKILCVVGQII